jgi:hypothetical protein
MDRWPLTGKIWSKIRQGELDYLTIYLQVKRVNKKEEQHIVGGYWYYSIGNRNL